MKTVYLFFLILLGLGLAADKASATRNFFVDKLFYQPLKVKEPQDKKSQESISKWYDKFSADPDFLVQGWRNITREGDLEMIYKEHLKWNVPYEDKVFQALIESGWEDVVSPSGATGHWQIMVETARKECGLIVDPMINGRREVDERKNKRKSTSASFCYSRKLIDMTYVWSPDPNISFSDRCLWSQVSYNWGPGYTKPYFKKCRGQFSLFLEYLPSDKKYDQVRNYVAKIFAARRWLRDYLSSGGEIESPAQFALKMYLKFKGTMHLWQ